MLLSQGSKRFQNIKQFCLFDAKEDIKIHCPELIKLAETIPKIKILTQTFFRHLWISKLLRGCWQCYTPVKKPTQNYTDYINRKRYFLIIVEACWEYWHCFMDVVAKWAGCIHTSRIFLQSGFTNKLRKGIIPRY